MTVGHLCVSLVFHLHRNTFTVHRSESNASLFGYILHKHSHSLPTLQQIVWKVMKKEKCIYIYKLRTKCNGENITSWWLCKTISFNKNLNNVLFYTFPVSRKRICAASFVVERLVYAYCGMSEWVAHQIVAESLLTTSYIASRRFTRNDKQPKKWNILIRTSRMKRGLLKWEMMRATNEIRSCAFFRSQATTVAHTFWSRHRYTRYSSHRFINKKNQINNSSSRQNCTLRDNRKFFTVH